MQNINQPLSNVQLEILKAFSHQLNSKELIEFKDMICLLYTSPSPRDATLSRMPSSA